MKPPSALRLQGRRAIITGAAHGIGLACAERFVAEGASVLLADLDERAGAAAAAELAANGAQAFFNAVDLSNAETIDALVEQAVEALGGVDILVNSAGIAPMAEFFDTSLAQFESVMAVNVRAPFLLTKAAAARMRDQGAGGAVVNLSSVAALLNMPRSLSYAVSKGAISQLTRACAIALAPYGIRVNAVGPGTIATEMAVGAGLTGEALGGVVARIPLGRLGEASEIAAVAAFLASDDAAYVTGQTVYADGGRLGLNYTMPA